MGTETTTETKTVVTLNTKYKVQFKQADTKGVIGFTVEANDDDIEKCQARATELLQFALKRSSLVVQPAPAPVTPAPIIKEEVTF